MWAMKKTMMEKHLENQKSSTSSGSSFCSKGKLWKVLMVNGLSVFFVCVAGKTGKKTSQPLKCSTGMRASNHWEQLKSNVTYGPWPVPMPCIGCLLPSQLAWRRTTTHMAWSILTDAFHHLTAVHSNNPVKTFSNMIGDGKQQMAESVTTRVATRVTTRVTPPVATRVTTRVTTRVNTTAPPPLGRTQPGKEWQRRTEASAAVKSSRDNSLLTDSSLARASHMWQSTDKTGKVLAGIGIWRVVSNRVKDGLRPPAQQRDHPRKDHKAVSGVAFPQGVEESGIASPMKLQGVHGHPFPDAYGSASTLTTAWNFFFYQECLIARNINLE